VPLGTEVGLGLRDIVLDGDPTPLPKGAQPFPQFLANVRRGKTAEWTKMPGDFVFDGDPATPRKRAHPPIPNFWPMSIVAIRLDGSRCYLVPR